METRQLSAFNKRQLRLEMRVNNMHPRPLSLSDRQLHLLQSAAKAVPVERRELFLQSVARHLTAEPTDEAVIATLNAQLDCLPRFKYATAKKDQANDQTLRRFP